MISLLAGIVILATLWWLTKQFAGADPVRLARLMKRVGGGALLVLAGILLFRGRMDMALLAGGGAAWLFGWSHPLLPRFGSSRATRSPGSRSKVRSTRIEMELDHDSGDMDGVVLSGALTGRRLASLDEAELMRLFADCHATDPDGARLLEAYLDRRFPRWREDAEADADARARPEPQRSAMTEQEAYQILGLQPGAGPDDIRGAHRALMKRLHPDQGGSTYLASRVNQAKDVLLNRHR
jgi:DnaJ domain